MPNIGTTIYRGVDYSPSWSNWAQGQPNTQPYDSDFYSDAFASLWSNAYQTPLSGSINFPNYGTLPNGDPSVPVDNTSTSGYRNDLGTIHTDTFDLVRLYNWGVSRGTVYTDPPYNVTSTVPTPNDVGLDHLNFLNYANTQKLKVVVPVSNYYLSDDQYSWNGVAPDSSYSFAKAPYAIQTDFLQFIASITDPSTGKIHTAVQAIDIGNEGDHGQGLLQTGTTAANFLARTNWWIYNLHQQINGTAATGPDGLPVINGSAGALIPITATMSDSDQGAGSPGGWWADLINGVSATTSIPTGNATWTGTFGTAVTGLSAVDPNWASYYYNSLNITQGPNGLASTLATYDSTSSPTSAWPFFNFSANNVALMFMEVFPSAGSTNAQQSVAQAQAIEKYLKDNAGNTNLIGYNYFEFNDEPGLNKFFGLYNYSAGKHTDAGTGTTSTYFGGFPATSFRVDKLTAAQGTGGAGTTLWQDWTAQFPATVSGTPANDKLVGTAGVDRLEGLPGNDSIDGGAGLDTSIYSGNAKGYTLTATAGSTAMTIRDKVGTDGTDALTSIETVRFADGLLATSVVAAAASLPAAQMLKVVDLYTAGLGRAPDALGLDYWASQLASGVSISEISKALFSSPEAATIYASSNSNPVFVSLAYQTALGRAPDAAGSAYWVNELNTGHIQRTDFVTALIAGARAPGGSAADAQYIANREAVGGHFALTNGLNNLNWAKAVEAGVNGTAASVTAANAQSDAFAVVAATPATTELVVQIVGLVP